ncbi:MAG: hypothetical protein QM811_28650 [Pirellulales bacterium]
MIDFDLRHCTRHCAATGRELRPGEDYFTVLRKAGADVLRDDYAADAWTGPPPDCLAWWKAKLPPANETKKPAWAPNDVLLRRFESLADVPEQADLRYVLALLLIRRRLLRLERSERDATGLERLTVYCARTETETTLPAILPDAAHEAEIQNELGKLLL